MCVFLNLDNFPSAKVSPKNLRGDFPATGIKDNLIPFIANINHAQEMYESLSKVFTLKNIGQVASLKN